VVNGVEGSHVGEEGLGSANVGGGLLTTNVLLTGLEGKTVGRVALGVLGDTDETTGHPALVLVLAGKESGVGTTVAEWDTEALGVSESNVGTPLAGGSEHGQGHEVGGSDDLTAISMDLVSKTLVVGDVSAGIRVLLVFRGREIGKKKSQFFLTVFVYIAHPLVITCGREGRRLLSFLSRTTCCDLSAKWMGLLSFSWLFFFLSMLIVVALFFNVLVCSFPSFPSCSSPYSIMIFHKSRLLVVFVVVVVVVVDCLPESRHRRARP
jgi:hypothetical protein